jgi:hypothetical protein
MMTASCVRCFTVSRSRRWSCLTVHQNILTRESLLLMCTSGRLLQTKDMLIANIFSGEYGMGSQANELSLGCDCLGQIHYLVRSDTSLPPGHTL